MKQCNKCGDRKPFSEFYRRTETGLPDHTCKKCKNEYAKQYKLHGPKKKQVPASGGETIHCRRCKIDLPVSQFSPRPDRPGKYFTVCKKCRNTAEKQRRSYRAGHPVRMYEDSDLKYFLPFNFM